MYILAHPQFSVLAESFIEIAISSKPLAALTGEGWLYMMCLRQRHGASFNFVFIYKNLQRWLAKKLWVKTSYDTLVTQLKKCVTVYFLFSMRKIPHVGCLVLTNGKERYQSDTDWCSMIYII